MILRRQQNRNIDCYSSEKTKNLIPEGRSDEAQKSTFILLQRRRNFVVLPRSQSRK